MKVLLNLLRFSPTSIFLRLAFHEMLKIKYLCIYYYKGIFTIIAMG